MPKDRGRTDSRLRAISSYRRDVLRPQMDHLGIRQGSISHGTVNIYLLGTAAFLLVSIGLQDMVSVRRKSPLNEAQPMKGPNAMSAAMGVD